MILSIPEGDDKPLKYPLMFTVCDVLVLNKIDAIGVFDFDIDAVKRRIQALNADISILVLSAKQERVWTAGLTGLESKQKISRR